MDVLPADPPLGVMRPGNFMPLRIGHGYQESVDIIRSIIKKHNGWEELKDVAACREEIEDALR